MIKNLLLLCFLLVNVDAFAQIRRDALWCFGDSAYVDFNQTPPLLGRSAVKSRGTATSITDSMGNLLFYTHTAYIPLWQAGYTRLTVVYNMDNIIMEGGDSLVGDGWYKENFIVPNPANNQQYYLFHSGITIENGLFYSVIDMSYNNGKGKVVQKNVLLNNLPISEGITGVKNGNGRDWWILFKSNASSNNKFYRYLVNNNGISSLHSQYIGTSSISNYQHMTFNSDGTKLLLCNFIGLLEVYDFDRCTGLLSNRKLINNQTWLPTDFFMDGEFSPDGNLIYVSSSDTTTYLYQFNLSAPNISSSRFTVDSISYPYYTGAMLKRAIDNKIYWSNIYSDGNFPFPFSDTTYNIINMNLSVINSPDSLGSACNFQPFSFNLGGARTYWGLPNNPDYDLAALASNPCPVGLDEVTINENELKIYPNPAKNNCVINALSFTNSTLTLYDLTGRILLQQDFNLQTQINTSQLAQAVYIIELRNKDGSSMKTKLAKE